MTDVTLEKLFENMESRDGCDVGYYIEDVLPARGRYAVGMAGSGKSTLILDQMLHVTSGKDWMGHKTTPCKVLWLNLNDEPVAALKIRVDKMLHSLGVSTAPSNLMIVNQSEWEDKTFSMNNKIEIDNTYELIDIWKPNIFVVDSLRKFLPFKDQVMNVKPLQALYSNYPNMVHFLFTMPNKRA